MPTVQAEDLEIASGLKREGRGDGDLRRLADQPEMEEIIFSSY